MIEKSLININGFLDRDELRLSIENLMKNRFQEGIDLKKASLKVYIKDFRNLKIDCLGDKIIYQADITLELRSDSLILIKADAEVFLNFSSRFNINEDWSINTQTKLRNHEWKKKPKINLSLISLPGTGIAEMLIGMLDDKFCQDIDQSISNQVKLKPLVEKVFTHTKNPLPIKVLDDAHLNLEPTIMNIFIENYSDKYIKIKFKLETLINVDVGKRPASKIIEELPACTYKDFNDEVSLFNIAAQVDYGAIEKSILDQFEEIKFKDRKVVIENIKISESGSGINGKISAIIDLKGDLQGQLFLACIPVLDKVQQIISLENFSFKLTSKNILYKALTNILKGQIEKKIKEEFAKLSLKTLSQQIKAFINNSMDQQEITPGLSLTVRVDEIDFVAFDYNEKGVFLLLSSEANLSLQIYLQKNLAQA